MEPTVAWIQGISTAPQAGVQGRVVRLWSPSRVHHGWDMQTGGDPTRVVGKHLEVVAGHTFSIHWKAQNFRSHSRFFWYQNWILFCKQPKHWSSLIYVLPLHGFTTLLYGWSPEMIVSQESSLLYLIWCKKKYVPTFNQTWQLKVHQNPQSKRWFIAGCLGWMQICWCTRVNHKKRHSCNPESVGGCIPLYKIPFLHITPICWKIYSV